MRVQLGSPLVVLALFWLPLLGGCSTEEPESRMKIIGVLNANDKHLPMVAGFKAGLADLGYQEGESIVYLEAGRVCSEGELGAAMGDLLRRRVDLVLALSTKAAQAAVAATAGTAVPVIFAGVVDPLGSGLATSMRAPDRNATGVRASPGTGKALEWLLRIRPGVKRILVPFADDSPPAAQSLAALREAAEKLQVELVVPTVASLPELEQALASPPNGVDGLFLLSSALLARHMDRFVAAAIRHQLPLASAIGHENGVPVTVGQDRFQVGRQASRQAHAVLQGTPAWRIPIEQPDVLLQLHLPTAAASGLAIPPEVLILAQDVIR
ncbi:MAG: ABC transporter substrate-binding protein [Thermodesulfobacteriota bacterium]